MAKITVIPSTKNQHTQLPLGFISLRKVAAYARVSTNTDEQYTAMRLKLVTIGSLFKKEVTGSIRVYTLTKASVARIRKGVQSLTG